MLTKTEYRVDDRVYFSVTPEMVGYGTVLGKSFEHIIDFYIVLLDVPIDGQKATVIPGPLLRRVDRHGCIEDGYRIRS